MEGPESEPPEGMSKNATRSRSWDVGGRVIVETARAKILGLIRMFAAAFECKHPRNRKTGCDAFDNTSLTAFVSINHPYASGERERPLSNASRREDRNEVEGLQSETGRGAARARDEARTWKLQLSLFSFKEVIEASTWPGQRQ